MTGGKPRRFRFTLAGSVARYLDLRRADLVGTRVTGRGNRFTYTADEDTFRDVLAQLRRLTSSADDGRTRRDTRLTWYMLNHAYKEATQ